MKHIIAIVIIAAMIGGAVAGFAAYDQTNRWVDINGGVHYNHPINDYQVAIEAANDICIVYEIEIADNEIGNVQGQTSFDGVTGQVVSIAIEKQDPAVVYHEMYHAMCNFNDPNNTEPNADAYATSMGFPIHDATY
jgi:hypothetical protein